MKRAGATRYAAVGAGLIALSWGLARYAFGLFVPPIRAALDLSPDVIGVVGALAFVSFALTSLIAPLAADRLGARGTAMTSGGFALAGLTVISGAGGAVALGTGVFACGISTGLMMPALSAGVQAAVRPALHGRVNAIMNAGTSLGLVLCVPAVLLLTDAWRAAYASFAVLAALGIVAAWRLIPAVSRTDRPQAATVVRLERAARGAPARLAVFAFAAGAAASPYWIFAPDLTAEVGGMPARFGALLWLTVGLSGIAGAWASDLADRVGAAVTNALGLVAVAAALALLAAAPEHVAAALVSAALFGWAFMTLSGHYLVTAIRLLPDRPALGSVVAFLAATIGQAAGSPVAGWGISHFGYVPVFAAAAGLALAVASCSAYYPRMRPAADAGSHMAGRSALD